MVILFAVISVTGLVSIVSSTVLYTATLKDKRFAPYITAIIFGFIFFIVGFIGVKINE